MQENRRERELRNLRCVLFFLTFGAAAVVALCCLYFALTDRYSFLSTGCALKQIFHVYCPGCGGTRAVEALLHGDLLTSVCANPMVVWMAFLLVLQYIRMVRALIRREPDRARLPDWTWISLVVLILGFFVVRNLLLIFAGYDYLGDNLAFWTALRA